MQSRVSGITPRIMKNVVAVSPCPAGPPRQQGGSQVTKTAPSRTTQAWPRYPVPKLLALHAYQATTSSWRVCAVLLLTPLPALLGALVPSFVPLENPLRGFAGNRWVILHGFLFTLLTTIGTITLVLGGASIPRAQYPLHKVVAVSVLTTIPVSAITWAICQWWRFPVPFLILLSSPIWSTMLVLTHAVLLRKTFQRFPAMLQSMTQYRTALNIQSAQFALYTGLTILFDRLTTVQQLAMVAVFPGVKFVLKKVLRKHTQLYKETSTEITISTIEICASLYQAMIMQSSPSALTMMAIMGLDLVQALVATKLFLDRHLTTPRREVMGRSVAYLQSLRDDAQDFESLADRLPRNQALVVQEGLELASAAEQLLLVEYYEVSVPIVNALFLVGSYKSTSTLYNTRLNGFYDNTALVLSSTKSVLLYSLLQGISLLLFHVVLRARYNMSAFSHLAFVLEHHWRSIQGKLLVFFTIIFYFTLLHYGTDFRLRFDFAALMEDMKFPPR